MNDSIISALTTTTSVKGRDRVSTSVPPQATSVYRYYDHIGLLLYVGITSRSTRRQAEHNASKDWWARVARQEVEHFPTRQLAEAREKKLIRAFRPPFNIQHNPDAYRSRATYLAFAEIPEGSNSVFTVVKGIHRKLPLRAHQHDGDNLILETFPQHAVVSPHLHHRPGAYLFGCGKRGYVQGVDVQNFRTTISTAKSKHKYPVLEAFANLKFREGSKPGLWVHNVHVLIDRDAL